MPVPLALKVGVLPLTGLLKASSKVTVTVEVATPSATTGLEPVIVDVATAAAPATNVTLPPTLITGDAIERVLISALVLASVQVALPVTSVTEQLPTVLSEPFELKVGVWPGTGLLAASRKMTVTVEVATPSATTGLVPVMLEFAAIAAPAVNVTVPSDLLTGDVIVSVFTSAVSDDSVQDETPEALVVLHPPLALSLPVSVARKRGSTPATGLLKASIKVMVMKDVATPSAVTGLVPVMVEVATATGPATKSTLPSVFVTGVTIANVFVSALVEASVQVETPFTSPTEHAESVLLVPVALNVGVKPGAGFPPASFSVTLIVLVATPLATIVFVPLMSEVAATGGPGSNTTVPPIFTIGVAIESVLVSALVEVNEQVDVPVTSLALQAAGVLPVPLAVNVGVRLATGLLNASKSVMVTVD